MKTKINILLLLSFLLVLASCRLHTKEQPTKERKEISQKINLQATKLTSQPGHHWFGYYDKLQMDPTGRYVLGMQVDFEGRSPTANDSIKIGMVDLEDNNRWIELGTSNAWGWQQGCMLQWRPGSNEEVLWNDREGDKFVCRVFNIKTKEIRTLPKAIYTLSNDGRFALGTEFSRIQDMRPGYGYAGIKDPYANEKMPDEIGIYKMDLETGANELIVSMADIASIPNNGITLEKYWHYFNHLLIAPDNKRFAFLHRYRTVKPDRDGGAGDGFVTRMFTANVDGSEPYLLDPSGKTSHFVWNDSNTICAWTKPEKREQGFYLLYDKLDSLVPIGKDTMKRNGHNTYVPNKNNEWILNDTYPNKENREQELYLYHVPTGRKVILGSFYAPEQYKGEWRCDLHPKSSTDGSKVIFDSTHDRDGRQLYMIDIGDLVKKQANR